LRTGAAQARKAAGGMTTPAHIRPFPWAFLDPTTRGEIATLRALRGWLAQAVDTSSLLDALASVIGVPVEIMVRRARTTADQRPLDDAVGVVFAPGERPDMGHGFLVAFELALATNVVARCLRRTAPLVLAPGAVVTPAVAGALGAILGAAARRAHGGAPLRVLATGPAHPLESDLARANGDLVVATATVLLERDAFLARLVVPTRLVATAPQAGCSGVELASALGPVALGLPIVACATTATVTDVASLQVGDVWLPGTWPMRVGSRRELVGPVFLADPASSIGVRADLGEDGRLVLGARFEALCAPGTEMADSTEDNQLVHAVGQVPVVVRVEIGEARMAAREWAALRPGDVVALGRRVGESVVLRVSGVPVARGDLVDVEGEVGVRIVERIAEAEWEP
jgi:flagellar motor switch/type III secretory pathway protein FliN